MPEETLPDDPTVKDMMRWIATTYHMPLASLARMFERSEKTIQSWMKDGRISPENLMRVRASYFHLHNRKDPHSQDRKCGRCLRWKPLQEFDAHGNLCAGCRAVPAASTGRGRVRTAARRPRAGRAVAMTASSGKASRS